MVKAPSNHGLDRKFRSWRKGKSVKANKQGSLKHQLRGHERLLAKLQRQTDKSTDNDTRMQDLKESITKVKAQIAEKENQEQQRDNAKKSHGTRFLERQRLTRMEKHARKNNDQQELLRIALDELYVAHYPLEKSYRPLFRNGKRWLTHSVSRAHLRHSLIQQILKDKTIPKVKWIPEDQYQRVPDTWSVKDEVDLFNYPKGGKGTSDDKTKPKETKEDNRFAMDTRMQSNHEAILQKAQDLESKLEKEAPKGKDEDGSESDSSDSSSDSDSSDSEEEVKPTAKVKAQDVAAKPTKGSSSSSSDSNDSDSSSDSSISSDSESEDQQNKKPAGRKRNQEELQSPKKNTSTQNKDNNDDSDDDDFFTAAKEDDVNVFDRVMDNKDHMVPADNPARGDKSQGWATQQQRPGKYKKKRTRN